MHGVLIIVVVNKETELCRTLLQSYNSRELGRILVKISVHYDCAETLKGSSLAKVLEDLEESIRIPNYLFIV